MTPQDPNDETISNPNDPWQRHWGMGSVITSLVAIVIMGGILAFGVMHL